MRIGRALVLALTFASAGVEAQDSRPCLIVITGVESGPRVTRMTSVTTGTGARNTFIGGAVDATCEGQGNRLLADSAEHFTDQGLMILYHNVRYSEPRVNITSDRMTYYTNEERLVAEGNVRGRTSSGTRFSGPRMEYFRAKPGLRDQNSWIATGRPTVRISPTEGNANATATADSTDLTANVVRSQNDSLLWASGGVILDRMDMRATSDSATVDNGQEHVRLLRDPRIVGKGERPFTLDGVIIDAWSRDRELQRVVALGEAEAVSDSLTLTSDTIDLRFSEQKISRIFSWGTRAKAVSPQQTMESDSMDVQMPGQKLERVHAIGRAVAISQPDTSKFESSEPDWITGDTLRAKFETLPPTASDSSGRSVMKEVLAIGSARAFYQGASPGGVRGAPTLSYNRGRQITVLFSEGSMSSVKILDQASGLYLEPVVQDSTRAAVTPPNRGRRP
jgi:lipopolysaccharide export system protein LptA